MADTKFSKWFESKVNSQAVKLQSFRPCFWHRFPDSYSARGALPTQPGDFLLVSESGSFLIEVKTSEVHESLRNCAASEIDDAQVGHHLLWDRAGQKSYFIFMSDTSDIIQVWNGSLVAKCRHEGKALQHSGILSSFKYSDDNLYSMLIKIMEGEL